MARSGLNLLVFREQRQRVCARTLRDSLLSSLNNVSTDAFMEALLRAGELEAAIADEGLPAEPTQQLTDRLAEAFLSNSPESVSKLRSTVGSLEIPAQVCVSPPEGFAYYGLHPRSYADALDRLDLAGNSVLVAGIRSIGTTLSAVTAAAARQRGRNASRITVRPSGHPYDRRTTFSEAQSAAVHDALRAGSSFLIVDEGPGLSGSSLLSVAEALLDAGASREQITIICAHQPDPESLCGRNAGQRWRQFRTISVNGGLETPAERSEFLGAGLWRARLIPDRNSWPASWTTFERAKYLAAASDGGRFLYKFAGLGHYGARVIERERAVAEAGFCPAVTASSGGFARHEWIAGRPMQKIQLAAAALARLAEYCAFRAREFSVSQVDGKALEQMVRHNMEQMGISGVPGLHIERPVIADARMQPWEWIISESGRMLKTDSGSHGDDHFFPGPVDIAWDLAGVIVEWDLDPSSAREFVGMYARASGDDPASRISAFVTAYCVFRRAYSRMAGNAVDDQDEQMRFAREAGLYERKLRVQRNHDVEAAEAAVAYE